jgi:hypothetical protein
LAHIQDSVFDGVRRIVAALISAVGALPDARDLGWLGLRSCDGVLSIDDRTTQSLAGPVPVSEASAQWVSLDKDTWELDGTLKATWDGTTVTLETDGLVPTSATSALNGLLSARYATHDGSRVCQRLDALTIWGVEPVDVDDIIAIKNWDDDDWNDDDDELEDLSTDDSAELISDE